MIKSLNIYKKNNFFFKIAKKELDRQRSKGLTHNPTRISQLENQIRQYEQQLNDIRRRLESIEVKKNRFFMNKNIEILFQPFIDPSQNKNDDNQVNRSNTFAESSTNRPSTVSSKKNKPKRQKINSKGHFSPHPHIYFSSNLMVSVATRNRIHCLNQQYYK